MDIAEAIKCVGSDVILHRIGGMGGGFVVGGHLKGERDKFVRELKEMKRGLLQDKLDSVMVAEIDECVEFVGKVTVAHSICSIAGPLMSPDEVEKVNRWLWTNREEQRTQAILDCPGLRELVAKLEQEVWECPFSSLFLIFFSAKRGSWMMRVASCLTWLAFVPPWKPNQFYRGLSMQ